MNSSVVKYLNVEKKVDRIMIEVHNTDYQSLKDKSLFRKKMFSKFG